MKFDKKSVRLVKKLLSLSKDDDGRVTESGVGQVIEALRRSRPRHHNRILKIYLKHIRREIAAQKAIVVAPAPLRPETLKRIETKFTSLHGRKIDAIFENDSSLIAGVCVRVGDDLYDASLAGRLKHFAKQVG